MKTRPKKSCRNLGHQAIADHEKGLNITNKNGELS